MSSLPLEISKQISLDCLDIDQKVGLSIPFIDNLLPSDCSLSSLVVSGGQVVERVYSSPSGEHIYLKMNRDSIFSLIS